MPIGSDLKNTLRRSAAGRLLRRFMGDREGVAAIEFTMLAIPFFLLIFAIIESCLSFTAQQVLSNAMDDVARQVRTGQRTQATLTEAGLKQLICNRIQIMVGSSCMTSDNLEVDLRSYTTFKLASEDSYALTGSKVYIKRGASLLTLETKPGDALSINTLRVFYKWPVLTDVMRKYAANVGNDKTLLFATTTWQNEPY